MTMTDAAQVPTPELDKQAKAREAGSQTIGEFLEWLRSEKNLVLARYRSDMTDLRKCSGVTYNRRTRQAYHVGLLDTDNCDEHGWVIRDIPGVASAGDPCPRCQGKGTYEIPLDERLVEEPVSTEELLAAFFEIDLTKVEAERRALLDAIRQPESEGAPA